MNLFWLKYVGYLLTAVAAILYFAIRLNRLPLARGKAILLYTACLVLACIAFYAQKTSQNHSPRKLILGDAVNISESSHRGGGISDEFQVSLQGGTLSPVFSTGILADSAAHQPIHSGDTLGVLYRTWDNALLSIDEIQGKYKGWHYSEPYDGGASTIFGVVAALVIGLLGILASPSRPARPPEPAVSANLSN